MNEVIFAFGAALCFMTAGLFQYLEAKYASIDSGVRLLGGRLGDWYSGIFLFAGTIALAAAFF